MRRRYSVGGHSDARLPTSADLLPLANVSPYLIGIAGPSCSGKTELASYLARKLHTSLVHLDHYYHDLAHLPPAERASTNFDEPASLDHDYLREQLRQLTSGQAVDIPVYDFSRDTRSDRVERVEPRPYILVEGLFALYWKDIRDLLQTKVYVAVEDAVCFERRLVRDVSRRGRTPENVRERYAATVRPMAEAYILPTRAHADVVVDGTDLLENSASTVMAHIRSRTGL